ncbi:type II secretion system protein [Rosistilla oblonga]|uniref:type II secretion system protein n=1 Tax=Rosistilla oblonga TaxID=2527990 RepID=UPI003A978D29
MQTQQAQAQVKRMSQPLRPRTRITRAAFTLIEILVAVTIIALLMGLLTPAVMSVMGNAREAAMKSEVDGIALAIESYRDKYGEYPPDCSDKDLVIRHFRTIYPQIAITELQLLDNMLLQGGTFSAHNISRAEALVFVLGGYSSNPQNPLTGDGGPFEFIGSDPTDITHYQYNISRTNSLFDFDITQLSITPWDPASTSAPTPTSKTTSSDDADIFPVYSPPNKIAPYVYFDSRTYGWLPDVGQFNSFPNTSATSVVGYVRPLKIKNGQPASGSTYGTAAAASKAWDFANPKSFQVIAAGRDDQFGSAHTQSGYPVYFISGTGEAMVADPDAAGPNDTLIASVSNFQASSDNSVADNITNFSTRTLEADVE